MCVCACMCMCVCVCVCGVGREERNMRSDCNVRGVGHFIAIQLRELCFVMSLHLFQQTKVCTMVLSFHYTVNCHSL